MTTTEDALAVSVMTMDKARRVGWAKAYEAEEKLNEAFRDVNMFRSDRDVYRNAISYMFGMFSELAGSDRQRMLRAAVEQYAGAELVMDEEQIARGRRKGGAIRDADELWHEERALAKAAKAKSHRESKDAWTYARKRGVASFAARYGVRSEAELAHILGSWAKAVGRAAIPTAEFLRQSKASRWTDGDQSETDVATTDQDSTPPTKES